MSGLIATYVTYGLLFAAALVVGFALGAALNRAVVGDQVLDLDGDVQALRIRVTEAKGQQERG